LPDQWIQSPASALTFDWGSALPSGAISIAARADERHDIGLVALGPGDELLVGRQANRAAFCEIRW
jgi:hypothetical protein